MSHSLHCVFVAANQVNDGFNPTVNILPNFKRLSGIIVPQVCSFLKYFNCLS